MPLTGYYILNRDSPSSCTTADCLVFLYISGGVDVIDHRRYIQGALCRLSVVAVRSGTCWILSDVRPVNADRIRVT